MMTKTILLAVVAALAALLTPSAVDAYGAAHVGYTHVGPNGVQHYGATEVRGPGGAYGGERSSAYGTSGSTDTTTGMSDTTGTGSRTSGRHHRLPRTGSDMPLLGLLGALSLAGALGLRKIH